MRRPTCAPQQLSPRRVFILCLGFAGFFGELLMLVCQTFTMSDLVMLLHGQHQPLSRIQPQLSQFFTQNYLNGREPTDQNIAVRLTQQEPLKKQTLFKVYADVFNSILSGCLFVCLHLWWSSCFLDRRPPTAS